MEKNTKTDATRERVILSLAPDSILRLQVETLKLTDAKEIALAKIIAEETEAERESRRGSLSNTLIPAIWFDETLQEIRRKSFNQASLGLHMVNVHNRFRHIVDTLHWDELFEVDDVLKRCAKRSALPLPEVAKFVCKKCEPRNLRAMLQLWKALRVMELAVDFVKDHRVVAAELQIKQENAKALEVKLGELTQEQARVRELDHEKYLAAVEAARQAAFAEVAKEKTRKATKSINTRHDQPNGYRDIKKKVLQAWATGKYKTHVECAEKTGVGFGIAIGTGTRYLINAPKPSNPA